jgi:hypothetical protein
MNKGYIVRKLRERRLSRRRSVQLLNYLLDEVGVAFARGEDVEFPFGSLKKGSIICTRRRPAMHSEKAWKNGGSYGGSAAWRKREPGVLLAEALSCQPLEQILSSYDRFISQSQGNL